MNEARTPARIITWQVEVIGRVQGVCYRAHTQAAALRLGLTGWVRNERNSSVCALLQHADEQVLSEMVAAMKAGPPSAWIDSLQVTPQATDELFKEFSISFTSPWHSR